MQYNLIESSAIGNATYLGHRFLQSFGAMTEFFGFMDQQEILEFQSVNRWMYKYGVSRVQTIWQCFRRYTYMAHPHDNKLLEYDAYTEELTEWSDCQFDLRNSLVMQIDQDTLITFSRHDLTATKYSNLRKVSGYKKRA